MFRRHAAHRICSDTTARTSHLVNGSGPHSLRTLIYQLDLFCLAKLEGRYTSGCALMIACLRVLCGSSVYVQKNCSELELDECSALVVVVSVNAIGGFCIAA